MLSYSNTTLNLIMGGWEISVSRGLRNKLDLIRNISGITDPALIHEGGGTFLNSLST